MFMHSVNILKHSVNVEHGYTWEKDRFTKEYRNTTPYKIPRSNLNCTKSYGNDIIVSVEKLDICTINLIYQVHT